jgi:hypothetical protein
MRASIASLTPTMARPNGVMILAGALFTGGAAGENSYRNFRSHSSWHCPQYISRAF